MEISVFSVYQLSSLNHQLVSTINIPHDGKGSVVGDLPKKLDPARLDTTIDRLVDIFDPKLFTVYLHCFNMQVPNGWPELTAKIESDARLVLA